MVKLFHMLVLLLVCLSLATACNKARFRPDDVSAMKAYITEPENGLIRSVAAVPFRFVSQYLPSVYLQRIQNPHTTALPADSETATFQLRITSLQAVGSLPRLFQQQAPADWTVAQQQHALLYGFEQVCSLRLGKQVIKPLFATVEMTAQTQRELSVVLVFPLTDDQLRTQPTIHLVLSPTYFLKQPLTFSYETAALLTVSR